MKRAVFTVPTRRNPRGINPAMAFRYNAFAQKVAEDPATAHATLVGLFKRHSCSTSEIASELGVNVTTLRRWVKRLQDLGYKDPGADYRRVRGTGKPKASAVR